MPPNFQSYLLRTVDATVANNDKKAIAYEKFPGIILVSAILPAYLEGWTNTKIERIGEIKQPQTIMDNSFGAFLIDRFEWINNQSPAARMPDERAFKSLQKNPDRVWNSDSLNIYLIEAKRERDKIKRTLHPAVQALIATVESMPDKRACRIKPGCAKNTIEVY
ncbi:MAG TPA: hypothetical protein VK536_04050 [Candidatus Limnocylindrales bacterium]|nr:hypothetical protein [Candidatus Limnocylindrales bacterium]